MLNRDESDEGRRERSLLDLGDALRRDDPQPSKLLQAIAEVRAERDRAAEHRAARSRRNARESPLIAALGREEAARARRDAPPAEANESVSEAAIRPQAKTREPEPAQPAEAAGAEAPVHRQEQPFNWRSRLSAAMAGERPAPPPASIAPMAARQLPEPQPQPASPVKVYAAPPEERYETAEPQQDANEDPQAWKPLIDPIKVIRGLFASKRIILATTIAGAMLGVLVAITTPKMYFASAELLADPRDLNLVERELTQSGLSTEATLAIVENQVRILQSQKVISEIVTRLKLDEDPEFNGTGPATGLVDRLKSMLPRSSGGDDPARRFAITSENLSRALTIERGGKTFVIVIGVSTRDGEKSALIANTMTEVFLDAYGKLQSEAAGRAADELNSKLDELRDGVEAAERKVEQYKAENDIIGAQGRLISDDELVKLNDQLGAARARTLELNARAASTRNFNVDAVLGGVLPEELASASIQELRAQYSALKSEADRLDVRLGPRHPQRMAIEAQLAGQRELINNELRRIVSSAQTELKRAIELEQELTARLAQLKVRQGSLSNELVTLRELERDATAKRAVYEAFLLRARETGEQQGINTANMSVISKAGAPLHAEPPSRSTIAMMGTILGFLAGVGIGFARGTWNSLSDSMSPGRELLRRPRLLARRFRLGRRRDEGEGAATQETKTEIEQPSQEQSRAAAAADPKDAAMSYPYPNAYPAYPEPQNAPQQPYQAAAPQGWQPPPPPAPAYAAPYPPQPMAPAYPAPQGWQPPAPPPFPQAAAPQQPYYWPGQQAAPAPYPYPPAPPVYAAPYPQAVNGYPAPAAPYPQPAPPPAYAQAAAPPPPPSPAPVAAANSEAQDASKIEEIRASLRECRDALRDLSTARTRRRYF